MQNLLEALRLMCYSDPLPVETDRIHVASGTLFLDGTFREEKVFCMNRLPVAYDPAAPVPEKWLAFLQELLYPEDIPTLQEYMGYCLIPSNKGQTMLFLIGNGSEGKSRIGLVMRSLLGSNMSTGSIAKVETCPFARADLEHRLVMVDDGKIVLTPTVELSYLTRQEQRDLLETMKSEDCTPSLSQAIRMKQLSQSGDGTAPQKDEGRYG